MDNQQQSGAATISTIQYSLPNIGTPGESKVKKKPLSFKRLVGNEIAIQIDKRPGSSNSRFSGCADVEKKGKREREICACEKKD